MRAVTIAIARRLNRLGLWLGPVHQVSHHVPQGAHFGKSLGSACGSAGNCARSAPMISTRLIESIPRSASMSEVSSSISTG